MTLCPTCGFTLEGELHRDANACRKTRQNFLAFAPRPCYVVRNAVPVA
jgi:hypothetical protein